VLSPTIEERKQILRGIIESDQSTRGEREYGARILAKMEGRPDPVITRYALSREQRAVLEQQQEGLCAICRGRLRLVVDHDHQTGVVRGLLCNGCNMGLGALGDTVESLERALRYLHAAK
jgi:hypothetical protein